MGSSVSLHETLKAVCSSPATALDHEIEIGGERVKIRRRTAAALLSELESGYAMIPVDHHGKRWKVGDECIHDGKHYHIRNFVIGKDGRVTITIFGIMGIVGGLIANDIERVPNRNAGGIDDELLPCPFCGSDADISDEGERTEPHRYWAFCTNPKCFVEGTGTYATEQEAIGAWNARSHRDDVEKECVMRRLPYVSGVPAWSCSECGKTVYHNIDEHCPHCKAKVVDCTQA